MMITRRPFLLAAFALALGFAAVAHAKDPKMPFKTIPTTDAGAGLAADFAVKERSAKTKKTVQLGEIVKAEDQEPKLFLRNFRLCLKVTDEGGKASTVQAVITVDQYSNHKLVSWAASKCGG